MNRSLFLVISLALFVVGLILMLGSVRWGSDAANAYLRAQGAGIDTAQFLIVFLEPQNCLRPATVTGSGIGKMMASSE